MDKRIKLAVILVIIVILLIAVFSLYFKSEEEKFVGSWSPDNGYGIMTLYSNGSGTMPNDLTFTWELKDGKFLIYYESSDDEVLTMTYNYSFSNNDNKLTLTDTKTGVSQIFTKEPSESGYLHLKTGETVSVTGEVIGIYYMNTTYGAVPIISLNNSISLFRDVNLLDGHIYDIDGWNDAIRIHGNIGEKYDIDSISDFTLHFEDFELNGFKFLWVKEFGGYLILPMAIQTAVDATSYYGGICLIQTSTIDDDHMKYEVFTRNNDTYPLNMFNVTLLSIPTPDDTVTLNSLAMDQDTIDITYEDNVLLSEALEKMLAIMSEQYVYVSGGSGVTIDFMGSLEDGISQNGTIEFVDANSNGLLDDYDYFNINISPTPGETIIDNYLFNLGNGLIYYGETDGSGVKYIINWNNGAIETITQRLALGYVSHEENESLVDTTIEISRIRTDEGYPLNEYHLTLKVEGFDFHYREHELSEDIISIDENISVEYKDVNNNGLVDVGDLLIVRGIENNLSVDLKLFTEQMSGYGYGDVEVGGIVWTTAEGYDKGYVKTI